MSCKPTKTIFARAYIICRRLDLRAKVSAAAPVFCDITSFKSRREVMHTRGWRGIAKDSSIGVVVSHAITSVIWNWIGMLTVIRSRAAPWTNHSHPHCRWRRWLAHGCHEEIHSLLCGTVQSTCSAFAFPHPA